MLNLIFIIIACLITLAVLAILLIFVLSLADRGQGVSDARQRWLQE